MQLRPIKALISLVVVLALAGGSYWQINFNKDWREQYAYTKGVDALIYAFPYYLNTVLRYKWSQLEAPEGQQVPVDAVNKFWHATFVDPKNYRDGGAPNADTLYSPAWVYAKEQPIIITVPEIPGNRYFAIELAGFDSDNFAYISKRLHGNSGGNYAIVPPNWQGDLPDDVEFVAHNPTPWFYAMARIYADFNDPSDQAAVAAIQSQMQIVGLSDWGKENPPRPAHPPVPEIGDLSDVLLESDVVSYIKKMVISDPMSFWRTVNHAMTVNGVPERDQRYLKDWAELHIGPDQDVSQAEENEQAGLAKAVLDGIMIMRAYRSSEDRKVNGWGVPPVGFGRSGVHGNFYMRGAIQSMRGIVANDAEEAMYMARDKDQNGDSITSEHTYELHFPSGQTPPARYFWSLTVYDQDANLMLNDYDRYAISGNSADLIYEDDGSLRILIGGKPPEGMVGNWLPAGESFTRVTLRVYGPEKAMLERTWKPPQLRRL